MILQIVILLGLLDSIHSATNVGGVMLNNVVWTSSGSANPYYLIKDVQIPRNVTLTIEPGVRINFSQGDFEIFVKGTIIIQGSTPKPVIFEGGSVNDLKWMLHLQSASLSNSIINYAQFKGPKKALQLEDALPNLSQNTGTLLVQSSKFTDTEMGTYKISPGSNSPSPFTVELRSCSFTQTKVVHNAGELFNITDATILSSKFYPIAAHQKLQITDSIIKNFDVVYNGNGNDASEIKLINSNIINATVVYQNYIYMPIKFSVLQSVVRNMSFMSGTGDTWSPYTILFQNSTISNISIGILSTYGWYAYTVYHVFIDSCRFNLGSLYMHYGSASLISIKDSELIKVNISVFDPNPSNTDTYNSGKLIMRNTQFTHGTLNLRTYTADVFLSTITLLEPPFVMGRNSRILCSSIGLSPLNLDTNTVGLSTSSLQLSKSTIKKFPTGIRVVAPNVGTVNISKTNFQSISSINIDNKGAYDVTATNNFWGTNDVGIINSKILDYWDDIHYGEVLYSGFSMTLLPAETACTYNDLWEYEPQPTTFKPETTTYEPEISTYGPETGTITNLLPWWWGK